MTQGESAKLIVDCNWFISASINRRSRRRLYQLLSNGRFTIIYCKELLEEYKRVITTHKYSQWISNRQVKRFIALVQPRLKRVEIHSRIIKSRDPKDNYLLELSKDSDADYLITGDKDLLVLEKIGKTEILTMSEFESIFFTQT